MRVVIAGGHGKIAQHLLRLLAERGDDAVALIRNPAHIGDISDLGADAVVLDLESADVAQVAEVLQGADAVVFAAGAGPGSSIERKDTVDRAGSVLLADGAEQAGVRRFVQVSSFGAGEPVPEGTDEVFTAYLAAKTAAEDDLTRREGLDWTVLRPGGLTDEGPTGLVALTSPPLEPGQVPRADVAAVLLALLDTPATAGHTLMLTSGDTPIADAVQAVVGASG
ncbi:SDR family oxidoreductase [Rhodococcus sp. X156]|uniref:SDR family oxidoreductase n=1 Tax=Rhodococcus sp. X156 TaxID=2499145 RepID=UPI000FDC2F2F|nr:SDR family oxidoreductase [Rhodococcus sp. X156]